MTAPAPEFVAMAALARAYQHSRALTVVAELGIGDLLAGGARGVDALAAATDTDERSLYRVLRALAAVGVFHEDDERRFSLTAMGDYLRTDHPLSVAPVAAMLGGDYEWRAWGELMHSVRTGENAATHALGVDVWEHRRQNPSANAAFDASMRTFTRSSSAGEIAAYDFGRHDVVADVGGGTGAMLAQILLANRRLRGILFDQPQVVAGAHAVLLAAGESVVERVTVVEGDFFDAVPAGADAYVVRRILHDWRDPECVRILRVIREVVPPDGCLIVIDAVVGPPNEDPLAKFLDLMMLVSAGGQERTEREWRELLVEGGFRLERSTRATANSYVIEAVPN